MRSEPTGTPARPGPAPGGGGPGMMFRIAGGRGGVAAGLAFALLVGGATAGAEPPRPARVAAVAPLHVAASDPGLRRLGESLGEVLAVALADRKGMTVVDRGKLADVLAEQKLGLSALVDPGTAAGVGRLLGADVVVAGTIAEAGGKLRYAVHVVAVDGRRVLGAAEVDGTRDDPGRVALVLAARVAAIAGADLPPTRPEDLDDSPVGRLHLMRGISSYYADDPDRAIASCLRAVQLDPRLQEARLWIARAYLARGEAAHARAELRRLAANPAAKHLSGQVEALSNQCERATAPPAGR